MKINHDIIEKSVMDGLQKKDITAHSNMIVAGAYPQWGHNTVMYYGTDGEPIHIGCVQYVC